MMELNRLATELLLCIADCLGSERDISAFAQTCHRCYDVVNPYLYRNHMRSNGGLALGWAAKHGREDTFRKLFQERNEGVNADVYCEDGTMMDHAVRSNSLDIVKMLLEQFAALDKAPIRPQRRLEFSLKEAVVAHCESLDMIKLLLDNGAYVKKDRRAPLLWILKSPYFGIYLVDDKGRKVRVNQVEALKLLLPKGIYVTDHVIQTLKLASRESRLEVIKLLLDHVADFSSASAEALIEASGRGRLEIVKLLIENGTDIHTMENRAISDALARGDCPTANFLLQHGARIDSCHPKIYKAFLKATRRGRNEILTLLLEHGFDASSNGGKGLHEASKHAHTRTIKLLLKHGVKINATRNGYNALYQAVESEHNEWLQSKQWWDGRVHHEKLGPLGDEIWGQRNLYTAVRTDQRETTLLLLREGAEIESQTEKWTRLMHQICISRNTELLDFLLDAGLNINAKGGRCGSLLQAAIWSDNMSFVSKLLARGADIEIRSGEYGTVVGTAVGREKCNMDMMKLLIDDFGANVNSYYRSKFTPLQIAISRGCDTVVQALLEWGADIHLQRSLHDDAVLRAPEGYRLRAKVLLQMNE